MSSGTHCPSLAPGTQVLTSQSHYASYFTPSLSTPCSAPPRHHCAKPVLSELSPLVFPKRHPFEYVPGAGRGAGSCTYPTSSESPEPPKSRYSNSHFSKEESQVQRGCRGTGDPQTTEGAFKSWLTRQTEGRGPLPPRPESRLLPAQLGAGRVLPQHLAAGPRAPPLPGEPRLAWC